MFIVHQFDNIIFSYQIHFRCISKLPLRKEILPVWTEKFVGQFSSTFIFAAAMIIGNSSVIDANKLSVQILCTLGQDTITVCQCPSDPICLLCLINGPNSSVPMQSKAVELKLSKTPTDYLSILSTKYLRTVKQ